MAFAYNLVTFAFTKAASALTMVIVGTTLKVVLILLGAFQASPCSLGFDVAALGWFCAPG